MIKKFVAMTVIAVALTLAGTGGVESTAEAREVYIGYYKYNGGKNYLLTQSVKIKSRNPFTFSCVIRNDQGLRNLNYHYYNGGIHFNDNKYDISSWGTCPEYEVYWYVYNNW